MLERNETLPLAVFLMGPTASGKTELALQLVQRFPFEIISVDSVLIYRDMDIGTAKPGADILTVAPHRLINILDASESYSVAQFCEDALANMRDICSQGKIPLLVGGTMLYYKALRHGLSAMPSRDPRVRAKLDQLAAEKGWAHLHEYLTKVDPHTASRLHPNDPQRIQRALEVFEISGIPMSEFHKKSIDYQLPYQLIDVVLAPSDRQQLHQRIESRFHNMLQQGLLEEVNSFYLRGDLTLNHSSMRAVGYRQVWQYLAGDLSYQQMVDKAVISTRQLAKRQFTWLRSEVPTGWYDSLDENNFDKVLKMLTSVPRLQ